MNKNNKIAYLFILPAIIFFGLIIAYPIFFNMQMSLYNWDGSPKIREFIGIENYISIFRDKYMQYVFKNMSLYLVITLLSMLVFGFFLAFFLSQIAIKYRALSTILRTTFFLPQVISGFFIGIIFRWILSGEYGYLNSILRSIGLGKMALSWIGDPKIAIYAVLFVYFWYGFGFYTIFYLAAMQSIPQELYEVADIDGANIFQKAIHITFPSVMYTHFSLIIIGTIAALKIFDVIWALTKAGPVHTTEFFTTYMYNKIFFEAKAGYGSAIAIILLILALIMTILYLKLYNKIRREQ
ncbi:MAG: sugar ABC transporter permease [Actinobacteria bacterium]|nr:sugar ABC transporter permease [Actinomycetota bacterium]